MIKLNRRQRQFVDNYEKFGGNYAKVCEAMHIGVRQYNNYLNQPAVKEYLDCSMERCKNGMIAALPHIQKTLLEMYNSELTDEKVKVQIAKEFLDRAGMFADKNVNVNVNINTRISDMARKIMIERQNMTIETTASPADKPIATLPTNKTTIEILPASQHTRQPATVNFT